MVPSLAPELLHAAGEAKRKKERKERKEGRKKKGRKRGRKKERNVVQLDFETQPVGLQPSYLPPHPPSALPLSLSLNISEEFCQ